MLFVVFKVHGLSYNNNKKETFCSASIHMTTLTTVRIGIHCRDGHGSVRTLSNRSQFRFWSILRELMILDDYFDM